MPENQEGRTNPAVKASVWGKLRVGICTNTECAMRYGAEKDDELRSFCEVCGSPVVERCPNCKTLIIELWPAGYEEWMRFCYRCGEELRRKVGGP